MEDGARRCSLCPPALPANPPPLSSELLGPFRAGTGALEACWVHRECAEFSPEVYWSEAGELCKVGSALRRGRQLLCAHCKCAGATLGCYVAACPLSYHYACAAAGGATLDSKRFLTACPVHAASQAFRYLAGPAPPPTLAASRALEPLLAALSDCGKAGEALCPHAEPLLSRLARLGERGMAAARGVAGGLCALAGQHSSSFSTEARQSWETAVRGMLDGGEAAALSLEAELRATQPPERSLARGARLVAPLLRQLQRRGGCGAEAAAAAQPFLARIARHAAGVRSARASIAALSALCEGDDAARAEGRAPPNAQDFATAHAELAAAAAASAAAPGRNAAAVRLPITCNGHSATLLLPAACAAGAERVEYEGKVMVGSAFEALAGREATRKWRSSCRVFDENGAPGRTVGDWLREHVEPVRAEDSRGPNALPAAAQRAALEAWRAQLHAVVGSLRATAAACDEEEPPSSDDDETAFSRRQAKRQKKHVAQIAPQVLGGHEKEAGAAAAAASAGGAEGWEGLAGCEENVRALQELTLLPLLYPDVFASLGCGAPRGVLLHGPPGTGKTQAVRSLVSAASKLDRPVAFFSRRGADCLGKYAGEAERTLRLLFEAAARAAPSVIFFDELDGLCPARPAAGGGGGAQDSLHASVVATLLALMDGACARGQVVVIAATNRPDAIDAALRRPGRFDRELLFPLPSPRARAAILKLATRQWESDGRPGRLLLAALASATHGYAGADLRALCTDTVLRAVRRAAPLLLAGDACEGAGGDTGAQLEHVRVRPCDWLAALASAPLPSSLRLSAGDSTSNAPRALPHALAPLLAAPLARLLLALRPLGSPGAHALPSVARRCSTALRCAETAQWSSALEAALVEAGAVAPPAQDSGALVAEAERLAASFEMETEVEKEEEGGGRPGRSLSLLICGCGEIGQTALAAAVLHALAGWALHTPPLAALLAGASPDLHASATLAAAEPLRLARAGPLVLRLPALELWAVEGGRESEAWGALRGALPSHSAAQPADPPFLLLATARAAADALPDSLRRTFTHVTELTEAPGAAAGADELLLSA